MNKIFINAKYCKGCLICVESCPKTVLQASSDINAKGYTLPEAVKPQKCNACGICEIVCPDFAIAVEKHIAVEKVDKAVCTAFHNNVPQ